MSIYISIVILVGILSAILLIDELVNVYYTLQGKEYHTILSRGILRGR